MSFDFLSLFINLAMQNANSTVQQINTIAKYRNYTEDNCNNFYAYTCDRWSEQHANESYQEITGLIDHEINKQLLSFIRNETNNVMDKVRTYLRSCETQKQRRFSQYLKIVKPAADLNWPLLDELMAGGRNYQSGAWQSDKFHWLLALANLRKFGLNKVFIDQTVVQYFNDSKNFIIDIDKPTEDTRRSLPDQLTVMALLKESIGLEFSRTFQLNNQLRNLEIGLFKLQKHATDDGANVITLAELQAELPQLPWRHYLETLINQSVDDNLTLQVHNLAYFRKLNAFLNKTEPAVICNYLMLHFVYYVSFDGSRSAEDMDCIADLRTKMHLAIDYIYYENFHKPHAAASEKDVHSIFETIRSEFRKILKANRLELTRVEMEYLENKLNAMTLRIGNVPANFNEDIVTKYYESIELVDENYIQNQLDLLQLNYRKEHERLLQPLRDADDFFVITDKHIASTSTAFFSARLNRVTIPYAFLRPPIYHHESHDALKYSLLGFNLAHEMAHGFDLNGILCDARGHLSFEIGKDIEENTKYVELFQCLNESATSSINERFADFIGLKLALNAFYTRNSSRDSLVFGQPTMQVFFLSFAQFFCGSSNAVFIDHDADRVRLEWSLMQSEAFREAFNCKKSKVVNEIIKCEL